MAYYILFDDKGNYMGYSTFKKFAYELVGQRKHFQRLRIQKVKDDFLDKKGKHELYLSGGDIFDYHGTYLFEHEQDEVHNSCLEYYKKVYESITAYHECINFIKFKDSEMDAIAKYTKEIIHMGECILDEYYSSEDPYYECFKVAKLALEVLKKIYKERE
jgi:hypothetical protein